MLVVANFQVVPRQVLRATHWRRIGDMKKGRHWTRREMAAEAHIPAIGKTACSSRTIASFLGLEKQGPNTGTRWRNRQLCVDVDALRCPLTTRQVQFARSRYGVVIVSE